MKKIIPYFFLLISWLCLFLFTGTFNAGYHFIDDFEIINLNSKLEKSTFAYTAKNYIMKDSERRFRPFWGLHRTVEVKLFGRDFRFWAVYTALLAVFTSFFLFAFMRKSGYDPWLSLLFVFLALSGPVTSIWFQYAAAENLGIFFTSLSLLFAAYGIFSEKHGRFYNACFVLSLLITALCKESFTILIPALLFLYLWLYSEHREINLWQSAKKNKLILLIPMLFMLISILIIVFVIGTSKTQYAGVDEEATGLNIILDFIPIVTGIKELMLALAGFLICIIYSLTNNGRSRVNTSSAVNLRYLFNLFLFLSLVFIPQYVLYYKTGFRTRYYQPLMLCIAFTIVCLIRIMYLKEFRSALVKYGYVIIAVLLVFYNVVIYSVPDTTDFIKERKAISSLLDFTLEKCGRSDTVLTVMDPVHHWGYGRSFYVYMTNSNGPENLYFKFDKLDTMIYPYDDSALYKSTEAYTIKYFTGLHFDSSANTKNMDFINIFPGLEEKFLNENNPWFEKEKYARKNFDEYVVYYRK